MFLNAGLAVGFIFFASVILWFAGVNSENKRLNKTVQNQSELLDNPSVKYNRKDDFTVGITINGKSVGDFRFLKKNAFVKLEKNDQKGAIKPLEIDFDNLESSEPVSAEKKGNSK